MKGSQAVAEVLRREGVTMVFCFPSNKMIDTAAARDRPLAATPICIHS
jgi:thiamine pyrophosphate-dependent acetolactate synthase large subunit-like protein